MSSTLFDRFSLRLGRAAILVVVGISPILIAESWARIFHDPVPVRRVYDPFAYRIPQPLLEEEYVGPEGDRIKLQLNELGMRGPSVAAPAHPDSLALVFLGGSTTENYSLPLEATFPELVGRSLTDRLGRPVRIFNAGMSAATTGTSLGRLQHQVVDIEPSLIVVMHAINDLMQGFHPRYRRDGRHLVRPALAGTLPKSYFYDWMRRRPPLHLPKERRSFSEFPSLPVFERNLLSMAGIARMHGIPILFLTQAHRYDDASSKLEVREMRLANGVAGQSGLPPDLESLQRGMAAFNAATLSLPTGEGISTFDLAATLPHSRELIRDECHFNRAGNRKVAEILAPVLGEIVEGLQARPEV